MSGENTWTKSVSVAAMNLSPTGKTLTVQLSVMSWEGSVSAVKYDLNL